MRQAVRMIIIEEGKVLLIHRIKNTEYWVFPGGGIEEGESHQQALKREAMEELGVEVEVGEKVFEEIMKITDMLDCQSYFYLCKITGGEIGTGNGPEWQSDGGYIGQHHIEWRSINELGKIDLKPDSIMNLQLFKV